jgi:Fe-S cluster assembly protein SufD
MNTIGYFKERFDLLQATNPANGLTNIRDKAFADFSKMGIPTGKHEEWKYTRVGSLFNKEYKFDVNKQDVSLNPEAIDSVRLPGHRQANELVFVNGKISFSLSKIISAGLTIIPLEEAAGNEYRNIVSEHLGHSANYLKDGIHALNTAFVQGGVFIDVKKGQAVENPLYVYNISDTRTDNILSQPRSLIHVSENAQVQIVETYHTIGSGYSFTNQVMEIIVEKNAIMEYYKIQNESGNSSNVSTTHIRQVGKSYTHTVTVSLDGGIVRNNLNVVLDAAHCESHLYGLYFQKGQSHIDNHTLVDNAKPNCYSKELYKGIIDDNATAVFNGKIYVRPDAQKTNAYQSNKNVLMSDSASVNTKPQLEIFADDVKCSHGCTVGQLNEEGLFYLQSRGITEKNARALLLHAFAVDVLEHIRPAPIREYVDQLISKRLEFNIA